MEILIVGEALNREEVRQKFGADHIYSLAFTRAEILKSIEKSDVVFDFIIADDPSRMALYRNSTSVTIFLNTSTTTLSAVTVGAPVGVFGFCGLPTFLNRVILEVAMLKESQQTNLEEICGRLKTQYQVVADRVGLVTARVICMIINEAYYTVEEGTATREDIDLAMKLGTNYPFGPFEWCERIGIKNVSRLLEAMYDATKDERYRPCPLLASESRT